MIVSTGDRNYHLIFSHVFSLRELCLTPSNCTSSGTSAVALHSMIELLLNFYMPVIFKIKLIYKVLSGAVLTLIILRDEVMLLPAHFMYNRFL